MLARTRARSVDISASVGALLFARILSSVDGRECRVEDFRSGPTSSRSGSQVMAAQSATKRVPALGSMPFLLAAPSRTQPTPAEMLVVERNQVTYFAAGFDGIDQADRSRSQQAAFDF